MMCRGCFFTWLQRGFAKSDLSTVTCYSIFFHGRCSFRHNYICSDIVHPGCKWKSCRMITWRMGYHPFFFSFSVSERTAFVAPRNLNAPTFWRFSHLRTTHSQIFYLIVVKLKPEYGEWMFNPFMSRLNIGKVGRLIINYFNYSQLINLISGKIYKHIKTIKQ